jgi:succinate-semialdehyde dehydrogenase/glutarate-semialdehyde dehydrogenase
MRNMGEACTAANRFYVHEQVADAFSAKMTDRMAALKMGNGLTEGIAVGPLVNKATRDKVESLVNDAVAKGAKVTTGGTRASGPGYFYPPTVLTDVPDTADLVWEEIFGPVAAIQTFRDEDLMIEQCNKSEYGLASYIYTRDIGRGMRVANRLETGMVGLNRGIVSDPAAPFGGVKQSGLGREGSKEGVLEYLETQYVSVGW